MVVHPRTALIRDPDLPAVATLLDAPMPPSPLRAAVSTAGGDVVSHHVTGVTWWPAKSATVTYRVTVEGGELEGDHDFVATTGRVPKGALVVGDGTSEVGVWRVPHDPSLPGMDAALDPVRAGDLLARLDAPGPTVIPRLRAYRPGRRAVVSIGGRSHDIYLKLVRPRKVEALHRIHQHLSTALPVPHSLGFSRELGLVAIEAMGGSTLRHALESGTDLPSPSAVAGMLDALPPPQRDAEATSPIQRLAPIGRLLTAILPEHADRIDELIESIGPEDRPPDVASHGDYYEAQVMVENGSVAGLLDVDTYGWGRAADDPATMLGHLDLWRHMSANGERVRQYAAALLAIWDKFHDPADLRRRVAAVHLTLAPGSFRVQSADWPSETLARIEMAERWLRSAGEIDEKRLTAVSGTSHGDPA